MWAEQAILPRRDLSAEERRQCDGGGQEGCAGGERARGEWPLFLLDRAVRFNCEVDLL